MIRPASSTSEIFLSAGFAPYRFVKFSTVNIGSIEYGQYSEFTRAVLSAPENSFLVFRRYRLPLFYNTAFL
jgi:hypothetical protein